jgi:2-polyprenyl-6-methoxyphenol hydroxylase-like FAD-dependent oxidoreductase
MLAEAGRKVVVLDRARFPADTLSTHAMFPSGCAEFQRIGVWPRILSDLDPARLTHMQIDVDDGTRVRERWEPVDGIDHGVSIPRDLLDVLLVENARERGAEVRERCSVDEVIWEHGRVVGITYRDEAGTRRRVRASIVVGADGRRSTVAAQVGAWRPYRVSKNGRGLVFRYMDDPAHEPWHRETMWQWRDGDSLAFAFPNPNGRVLTLFMGDAAEVADARRDPEAHWAEKLAQHPGCAARIEGGANPTKLRSTGDVVAYWRASSGPGWVLAGDASHFKDPVTGQGMGDALRMGRTLGEALAPALGDPAESDRRTRRWEHETATHCLHAYHFANFDTMVRPPAAVFREVIRELGRDTDPALSHVLGRTRTTQQVFSVPLMLRATARAIWRGPGRGRVLRETVADFGTELRVRRELARNGFRSAGPVRGSDHPGARWWEPPAEGSRPA